MAEKIKKEKKKGFWKSFIRYYTRFPIPWWLYAISIGSGIVYTELGVALLQYNINLNTGKLQNSTLIGYAGITLLMTFVSIVTNMTVNYASGKVSLRSKNIVWRKILRMPMKELDGRKPSSLISRVTADAAEASQTMTTLSSLVTSLYSLIRVFMVMYNYSHTVTYWLLLAIPLAIANFWLCGKIQFLSKKKIYAGANRTTSYFSEHVGTMKYAKAQVMEEQERKGGFEAIEQRFKADIFYAFSISAQTTSNSIYTKACTLIMVFAGKHEIEAGRLPSTGINETNTYLNDVQKYLAENLTHYTNIKGTQGVMDHVLEIMNTESETVARQLDMPDTPQNLVLEHVSFGYSERKEVLHDITLTIPAGKKTAIVGDNGSGKSTLFKLLMRFYAPTEGAITYGGNDIDTYHMDQWRRSYGYVLQHAPLLSGSVRDNICYGLDREATEEEIIAAAKIADAYDFIMEFPEGFDKEVGEGGSYLSGGQRQRIAIARAVMMNPSIMLMDEATSALDVQSDSEIWKAMSAAMEGRTTVLIAHDMNAVMSADNIVVMAKGAVEATGTHAYCMEHSPTYREYVRLQSAKEAV